jgi:hypothetical protein
VDALAADPDCYDDLLDLLREEHAVYRHRGAPRGPIPFQEPRPQTKWARRGRLSPTSPADFG